MEKKKAQIKSALQFITTFLKWVVIATITGTVSGVIGTAFHTTVEYAPMFRDKYPWTMLLLPVGGIVIIALHRFCKMSEQIGTNQILKSVRADERVPILLAPLIFISTAITHFLGGSAGREGAALQLGGSIGAQIGRWLHLDDKDMSLIIMAGMSSVFAALFGTPLTATLFAMEVVSVGVIYYSAFVPCIVASLVSYGIAIELGATPLFFELGVIPAISVSVVIQVVVLAALCAVVSIAFCMLLHATHHLLEKKMPNAYLRIFVGGVLIVLLTFLVQTRDYNGAGMNLVANALEGTVKPEAFLLKMIFTAITIGAGYKGGEIVPTFFVGATFGCLAGGLLGLDPGFAAAIGLIAMFCGVINAPVASIILSVELFGAQGLLLFAIASGVSYLLSGYYGLYNSQKIVYSKLTAEYINRDAA